MAERYRNFNTYLKSRFGRRVHKLTVDAGFTCPNRDGTLSTGGCIYCNPSGSGTGAFSRGISIVRQLETARQIVGRRFKADAFIAYFQSFTNTYGPLERMERCWNQALEVPGVVGLSIGTRPDCVDDAVADLLARFARRTMVWVELGLQSACDRTLALINRGHDAACFAAAVKRLHQRQIPVCAHIILGLPGEGAEQMNRTADFLADLAIDAVKIHLLYVVRGTELERWYRDGRYRPLDRATYVERVCDVLERLPAHTVVQRLTGDPHRHELVAPMWALEKQRNLQAIARRLEERDSWQAKRNGAPRPVPGPDQPPERPAPMPGKTADASRQGDRSK